MDSNLTTSLIRGRQVLSVMTCASQHFFLAEQQSNCYARTMDPYLCDLLRRAQGSAYVRFHHHQSYLAIGRTPGKHELFDGLLLLDKTPFSIRSCFMLADLNLLLQPDFTSTMWILV